MIDARCESTTKLVAPEPLPYVSRKALRRIQHPAPVPTVCQFCGCSVELVNNSEIYGKEFGDWPYAYRCENWNADCGAYVGLHPNTDIPLGTLADKKLRTARNQNKKLFLELTDGIDRNAAYSWLAEQMQLSAAECHFGLFDVDQCVRAGAICRSFLGGQHA